MQELNIADGDWYSDKSSLPNLLEYLKMNTNINTSNQEKIVEIGDEEFIKNSYFYLTGHGNITLSDREQFQLRNTSIMVRLFMWMITTD